MDDYDYYEDDDDYLDDDPWARNESRVESFVQRNYGRIFALSIVLLLIAVVSGASLVVAGLGEAEQAEAPAPIPEQPFSMGARSPVVEGVVSLPAGGTLSNEVAVIESPPPASMPANSVAIPDLDVTAKIVDNGIVDNELIIPDNVRHVTRYVGGSKPGDPTGTVLLAGHVSSRRMGRGALFPLHRIQPGTVITVTDESGVAHRYAVVGLITTGKDTLPDDLFSNEGQPRLVIITCGGPLERTPSGADSYRDNVVVTALPIPPEDPPGESAA